MTYNKQRHKKLVIRLQELKNQGKIEILGKSNKDNEDRVIAILKKLGY